MLMKAVCLIEYRKKNLYTIGPNVLADNKANTLIRGILKFLSNEGIRVCANTVQETIFRVCNMRDKKNR